MKERKISEVDGVTFIVESVLGQGGTAEVLKVPSSVDDKVYALKQIAKDFRSGRNERFRNEIAFGIAARNDHDVRIHAKFEDAEYFCYTMELYSKSLREIISEESDH